MRRSTKWCAADPGPSQTPRSLRSRVCSAPFRCAACCAAPGKRVLETTAVVYCRRGPRR